jgi:hypothetical protein
MNRVEKVRWDKRKERFVEGKYKKARTAFLNREQRGYVGRVISGTIITFMHLI